MAKKETKMQSNEAELKAIAKAAGASLTRNGHKVPHSNILHALSAALDTLRYLHGTVTVEVGYVALRGWYVSATGAADFFKALEKAVPDELILGALDPLLAPHLPGPAVVAEFWTDDRAYEVSFDAREYLTQATDEQLQDILDVGYRGACATDDVAEYCAKQVLELREAFDYLDALNKSSRNTTGFECSVDSEQFLRWMDVHRRPLLAKILCKRRDVCVATAVKEALAGSYCWELREEGSTVRSPLRRCRQPSWTLTCGSSCLSEKFEVIEPRVCTSSPFD